jgi:hypothetical protein
VKDRTTFVTEALLEHAELFAGLLAPVTKPSLAKRNLILTKLKKFCPFAPLKIALTGGFKHSLIYMLFYEIITYIEAQVQDQSIAQGLYSGLNDFLTTNLSSTRQALADGKNPVAHFEKNFLRKIGVALTHSMYHDTNLPVPIPLTWVGHILLGNFNVFRSMGAGLEYFTTPDFLDTPLLANVMNKNILVGTGVAVTAKGKALENLSKHSFIKLLIPALRGTQLTPDFYNSLWFVGLKKFFIAFLTMRNIDQTLLAQLAAHMTGKERLFKSLLTQAVDNKKAGVSNAEIQKALEKEVAAASYLPKSFSPLASLAGRFKFLSTQGLLQDGLILLNARSKASLTVHLLTLGIPLVRALAIPFKKFFPQKGG